MTQSFGPASRQAQPGQGLQLAGGVASRPRAGTLAEAFTLSEYVLHVLVSCSPHVGEPIIYNETLSI